jgi:hypothetical protein
MEFDARWGFQPWMRSEFELRGKKISTEIRTQREEVATWGFELRGKRRSGMERNRPVNSLGRGFLQPPVVVVDPIAMKPEPPTEMFRHSLILLIGGSAEGRLERE